MSAPSAQKNTSSPISTALTVIGGSVALVVGIALIAHFAVGAYGGRSLKGDPAMSDEAVAKRLKPIGDLLVVDASTAAAKAPKTGEQVYTAVCSACHAAGVLNAPKFGDKDAWSKPIAQGYDTLVQHAINGIRGMPARGGNPDLSDAEVAGAVAHMANSAGANFKAQEPAAAVVKVAAATPAAVATVAPAAAAAKTDPAKGKSVYETTCAVCHAAGVAGAPKFADKGAWAPRIAQGAGTLHDHALKGFQGNAGVMPPKGGNVALPDSDVIAAVDYMVSQAK